MPTSKPEAAADSPAAASDTAAADLAWLRSLLQAGGPLAVLTGAGVSAESGVPTFRDAQTGYWAQFDAMQMATEAGFRAAPERVWNWYAHRIALLDHVQPNAGHRALAAWQAAHPGRLTLITQNVDGLHQQAGSTGVLCLHGDLRARRWLDAPRPCCDLAHAVPGAPPHCATCGNQVRPGVVWCGLARRCPLPRCRLPKRPPPPAG